MNPIEVKILYEQGPCLVVFKPAGVLTQGPPGIDSMELRVKRFLQTRESKDHNLYLGIVHRLDRPVTGALAITRHVRAAKRISEQFEERTVEKKYWTIVQGSVSPDQGTWVDSLRKVPGEARSEIVDASHPDAQQAILHFRVLDRNAQFSFLEIELETGRTHQIRLQCASHGHPILGDDLYGSTIPFGPPTDDVRLRWIALHARHLGFKHPMNQEPVRVTAPLPVAWQDFGLQIPSEPEIAVTSPEAAPPL